MTINCLMNALRKRKCYYVESEKLLYFHEPILVSELLWLKQVIKKYDLPVANILVDCL